ncbi:hypothetical protein GYH30_003395 [Glycine max]|uniref:Leucine-rich repeat-containing N-terminal plant-type domain-containing protein n=1 Tax=Glycine max TaxID=3847 RepID=A0A0R0KZ98_SOYBN|nr:hypothetical protein GYH30_003395 [Glycine max]
MESWIWWFLLCWHLLILYFSPSHSLCHPHDSFALLQFKNSFTIKTSYHNYYCHPGYSKTTTWENGTDCCSWPGVTCHHISGHVTELDLTCSGLTGKIHPNSMLFQLSHLQSLNLAFNDFNQPQLSSLFGGFLSLTHLNLSGSNFEGEIPSQISHLSKLASLDFSSTNSIYPLKWEEDTWKRLLQNATVLRELDLAETDMSSISIRTLNMSSCFVTLTLRENWPRGNLTDDILCLPNLQHLYLSENWDLQGQLPESLHLSYNKLQGNKSESIFSFLNLTLLDLSSNNLSGSVNFPLFSRLQNLDSLYLSQNDQLSLNFKSSVKHSFPSLRSLDLSSAIVNCSFMNGDVFAGGTQTNCCKLKE